MRRQDHPLVLGPVAIVDPAQRSVVRFDRRLAQQVRIPVARPLGGIEAVRFLEVALDDGTTDLVHWALSTANVLCRVDESCLGSEKRGVGDAPANLAGGARLLLAAFQGFVDVLDLLVSCHRFTGYG